MGVFFSSIYGALFGPKEQRILVLGLDNAGKTTILYRMHLNEMITTVPTVGFNVETIQFKNLTFQVWDLGGQTSIRPYWRCYYPNTDAIIFVVDSADTDRISVAETELQSILHEEDLQNACLLIFANKQDIKGCLKVNQLSDALDLSSIRDRQWTIFESDARSGRGIKEGFEWLANQLHNE